MHTVSVTRTLPHPFPRVWEALDDFGAVQKYHPTVEKSGILNGIARGEGAQRVCQFYDGSAIKERITEYRAGRGYTVEIVDFGPFPLKQAVARISAQAEGDGKTRVTFKMSFLPRFGPFGWVMAQTMMKPQFRRVFGRLLQGLDDHLRTGKEVGRGGRLAA